MSGKEKRRDPRVPLVLRVEYPATPEGLRDATENLSAGGLFIRTDRSLAPGERVPLQIGFPGLLDAFEVEVEVVRRRAAGPEGHAGVAVKIPLDRIDDRHKFARLVETARAAAAAAERPPAARAVPAPPRPATGPRAFRVLVVEDNAHVVEMYEYALRKLRGGTAGVDVVVEYAANGHDALLRLEDKPRIDLVMADIYMPVMDGFSLVERVKCDPNLMDIPVLVISAGGADARARALDLGADVYLQKPVQFADIIATVRTLLHIGR
jgi:uncharacterized protein (TIGR02266 family)